MTVPWKRFPVPAFDHRALKGLEYLAPAPVDAAEADRLRAAAAAGDASALGLHWVEPDAGLLGRLNFEGEFRQMAMCLMPGPGAHLLARSLAWFNQRLLVLDGNGPDAQALHDWRTPRTHNTRLGPEDGVTLDHAAVWLVSGRVVEGGLRGNRLMADPAWTPPEGLAGFRVVAGCDKGGSDFHDTAVAITWAG